MISAYSLIEKHSKEYRNALRSIRCNYKKYGAKFDNSELWNLDITIYKYVYIHKLCDHLFLAQCCLGDQGRYNKYWKQQGVTLEEYNNNYNMYWEKEKEMYKEVNLQISQLTDKKFLQFLLPRLKAFKDKTNLFPGFIPFSSYKEYLQNSSNEIKKYEGYLQDMIDEIETKGTCTLIYEKINYLWT